MSNIWHFHVQNFCRCLSPRGEISSKIFSSLWYFSLIEYYEIQSVEILNENILIFNSLQPGVI